jgi:general secretion pathway protein G
MVTFPLPIETSEASREQRTTREDSFWRSAPIRQGAPPNTRVTNRGSGVWQLRAEGYTFVELLIVTTVLLILASAVLPLTRVTAQRQREAQLHRALREIRTAIDGFKDAVDQGRIASTEVESGSEGYPPDLETLVEGVTAANDASGLKLKFLRRVPIDPLTTDAEWGLRAYSDAPDSRGWGGKNVYDVYSKNEGTALDGTKYRDW